MKLRLVYTSITGLVALSLVLLVGLIRPFTRASEQSLVPSGCVALDSQSEPWPELEIKSQEVSAIKGELSQVRGVLEGWQSKVDSISSAGLGAWVMQVYIKAEKPFETHNLILNPVRLSVGEGITGFLLMHNSWQIPHAARLIFLQDFQQMHVQTSGETRDYLDLSELAPDEEYAVQFQLPRLDAGFHQLSILVVTDPFFLSTEEGDQLDPEESAFEYGRYRLDQRDSAFEYRQEIWVELDAVPADKMLFDQTDTSIQTINRHGLLNIYADSASKMLLFELDATRGQPQCIPVEFPNCGSNCRTDSRTQPLYEGPFPVTLIAFWDDVTVGSFEFDFPSDAPQDLSFEIELPPSSESGQHQLQIVAFPLPGYSQFNHEGERTVGTRTSFSVRMLVDVSE